MSRDLDEEAEAVLAAMAREERSLPPCYRDTLLPEGASVIVALRDVDVSSIQGAAEKWFVSFKIVDSFSKDAETASGLPGATILRSYNAPRRGWLSRSHSLYADYSAVVGKPLRTVPKVSPRAFVRSFLADCYVEVVTRQVRRRMDRETRKWVETPPEDHYSVISRIVKLAGGCPPVLRIRGRSESQSKFQSKREPQ